jgi:hypothetical protein
MRAAKGQRTISMPARRARQAHRDMSISGLVSPMSFQMPVRRSLDKAMPSNLPDGVFGACGVDVEIRAV